MIRLFKVTATNACNAPEVQVKYFETKAAGKNTSLATCELKNLTQFHSAANAKREEAGGLRVGLAQMSDQILGRYLLWGVPRCNKPRILLWLDLGSAEKALYREPLKNASQVVRNWMKKLRFFLPTAGRRRSLFHPKFTKPGKHSLEAPCSNALSSSIRSLLLASWHMENWAA